MRRTIYSLPFALLATTLFFAAATANAQLSYWRFEGGTAGADVVHGAAFGVYAPDVPDATGNGNELSMFGTGGCCGYGYRSDVPWAIVPQTGAANALSAQNTGANPATFTDPGGPLNGLELSQWTIQASWKPENGGFRTIVGRDGRNVTGADTNLSSLYLQAVPGDALAIKFVDEAGNFHVAQSAAGVVEGFNFPNVGDGKWHNIAAVSDGSTLSLYLDKGTGYNRIATADLTGSADSRLTDGLTSFGGTASGGDWTAGDFTVGRGLYAGGHGDRAYGLVDEVQISDTALSRSELLGIGAAPAPGTLAHWRFEGGPADANVAHGAAPAYPNFAADVPDASGNGNALSMWDTGGGTGFAYRSDVPGSTLGNSGVANDLSIQNTGGFPATFSQPGGTLSALELSEWTVEASWKPEVGGFRTVVGRDAQGVSSSDGNLAALYVGATPANEWRVLFTDEAGVTHNATSAPGLVNGWQFGVDDPADFPWYNIAAVSDGETLSLFVQEIGADGDYVLVAESDLTLSGSTNTALTDGFNDIGGLVGADWSPGDWTVGRGLYGGGHADRAYGFIDEVRISSVALAQHDFLFAVPEPASIAMWTLLGLALGGFGYFRIRKK